MVFRCNACGHGIVEWVSGSSVVMVCHGCEVKWVVNSQELVEWQLARVEEFTNREEL